MIKRTIYISSPSYLKTKNEQLVVNKNDDTVGSVPIEDIGVLILDHPQITITHTVIRKLQLNNSVIISCDEQHMPYSLTLPLVGHSEQMKYQRVQLESSKSLLNNLWKQTIKAKIKNQSLVLSKMGHIKKARHLLKISERVISEDKTKLEGYAASVYWDRLLKGQGRDRYGAPPNNYLNYVYAIIRSMVARAIVGAGLIPTVGIHHKNKYNPFCLVDDIMEPFRPFGDLLVLDLLEKQNIMEQFLSQDSRNHLLSIMTVDGIFGRKSRPLMVGIEETAASLRKCMTGERRKIIFPSIP